jgi:hypothetical protein
LSSGELVFGSWSPELLPILVVREAYGTRARDTDWLDGYYPYHEMNAYMGLIAIVLAVVGGGGAAAHDRWVSFWVLVIGAGSVLMLGKFTFLFDHAHELPILGSSREPVRFHLWVSLGVAALAAVGVERLARPGVVSLRGGLMLAGALVALSIPIMIYIYAPVWTQPKRWTTPYHLARYGWLGREIVMATIRTTILVLAAWWIARGAARQSDPVRRARRAAILPVLVLTDLLSAHWFDAPSVDPSYWTVPPESARRLKANPDVVRIFGIGDKHSGEPGYASEPVDFRSVRDPLDWSLPLAWHLAGARGNTPMISRRLADFTDRELARKLGKLRYDLEGDTHIVTGKNFAGEFGKLPRVRAGTAYIHRNAGALPRARLMGSPVYVADPPEAIAALERLGSALREQLVVEDPDRPLAVGSKVVGAARIVEDLPERVVVETECTTPSYLVLADTFDPGWSATVDGQPAAIRPAYLTFRAVFVSAGRHTVVFTYRPVGFELGLALTGCGMLLGLVLWLWPGGVAALAPAHARLGWPINWRSWYVAALAAIVLISAISVGPGGRPRLHRRWNGSFHQHTWGAGLLAMKQNRR